VRPIRLTTAAALLAAFAASPHGAQAEAQYIVEQVVVSVSAAPDGSGDRVGSVHSGEQVEVLEREEDHARIRFGTGQEGWIKASYLSSDPPLRPQLEERGQELARLHKDNASLQAQLADLQRQVASQGSARRDESVPPAAPRPSQDPPAQDPPMLNRVGPELTQPRWSWLAASALVALACGFVLGWRLLDRRIRKRYGGLRIY
jgi:hypothetical protein